MGRCPKRTFPRRCEIRLALLEADVNFQVVKDFVARRASAVGVEVTKSLTPGKRW